MTLSNPPALINGYYPKDYFDLPGVDDLTHPSELWWSSTERAAVVNDSATSEYLELDFGRVREINYLTFDIMKKPVNVRIWYDVVSFDGGSHQWVEVKPLSDDAIARFDARVNFDGSINPWQHSEFFFSDPFGNLVATRFIRVQFTRRNETWPSKAMAANIWSIDVANLRTARYITSLDDTRGLLLGSNNSTGQVNFSQFQEIRQPFSMPNGYTRGDSGFITPRDPVITPIIPNIVGFSVLADINVILDPINGVTLNTLATDENIQVAWELWDITSDIEVLLRSGTTTGATNIGKAWIDVFFDSRNPVETTSDSQYEIRIRTLTAATVGALYTLSPNTFGGGDVYALSQPLGGVRSVFPITGTSLCFRVWADIGESGKDVLGNQYREGVRRDQASNVLDSESRTSWLSFPSPSPDAVECLYFDVRNKDIEGNLIPAILDAFQISPYVSGPFMHIYYSNEGANLKTTIPPRNIEEWESLLWTPIKQTYVLDKTHLYELPRPIRASWICLEFTNLQPMPYPLPEIPDLPAVAYKTHPAWVTALINQFGSYNGSPSAVNKTSNQVQGNIFDIYRTIAEFDIGSRVADFLNDSASAPNTPSAINPTTLAQIILNTPQMWTRNLASDAGNSSSLGKMVSTLAAQSGSNTNLEYIRTAVQTSIQNVSTSADRSLTSFATQAIEPTYFDRTCRHSPTTGGYRVVKAKFNKKAYFVGVTDVSFFRKDFTTERDDPFIHDILAENDLSNSPLLELNTWQLEVPSTIPVGQQIYVSYTINNQHFNDEAISFEATSSLEYSFDPILLSHNGGRASNVAVYSAPSGTGQQFTLGLDFDIAYDPDTLTNSILRNALHYRLITPRQTDFIDIDTVTGKGSAFGTDSVTFAPDSAVIIGSSILSTAEAFVSGHTDFVDTGSAGGTAVIFGTDIFPPRNFVDADSLTGSAVISGVEDFSGSTGTEYTDAASTTGQSLPFTNGGTDLYSRSYDEGESIVTGTSVLSASELLQPAGGISIIERPSLEAIDSSTSTTAFTPIFYPLAPEGQKSFPASSLRIYPFTISVVGVQASAAIYSFTYTGSGLFSANLVSTSGAVALGSLGDNAHIVSLPLAVPQTLDFTVSRYFVGVMLSGTGQAIGAAPGLPNQSILTYNAALADIASWPASFNQTNVVGSSIYPYIAVVSPVGEFYT